MSTGDFVPVIVALISSAGIILAGVVALRKSGPDNTKTSAEAADTFVGTANEVVVMLRETMAQMRERQNEAEARILMLEASVNSWEGWAERVLDLLDRAVAMLGESHRASLEPDVEEVRRTRPVHHGLHAKNLVPRKEP